jgi:hypothetical protein
LAGFHRLPAWEGWVVFGGFGRGAHGWWLTPTTAGVAGNSLRPLEVLPHQIGYTFAFGSFVAFNVVAMLAFVARAVAAYVITRELLPTSRAVAFGAAFIFALSPAADGAMLDRTIHVQWSGALMMAGVASLLVAARRGSAGLAVGSALLVASGILMYEAVTPAAILVSGFVFARARKEMGAWSTRSPAIRSAAIYSGGIALAVAYLLWSRTNAVATTYQDTIATTRLPLFDHAGLAAIAQAFKWESGGFLRHAVANDLPMRRPVPTVSTLALGLGLALMAAAVMWILDRGPRAFRRDSSRELVAVACLGVLWTVVSLAIFLPFRPYRYETLRVHSLAQFGPVVVFAVVATLVMRWRRMAGIAMVAAAVFAAAFVAVQNARLWAHWSDFQSQTISALVGQAAGTPQKFIVVRDDTDRLSHVYELGPSGLFLQVAYDIVTGGKEPRTIVVCNESGISAVGADQEGACTWATSELIVQPPPGTGESPRRIPRSSILDLTLHGGDQPQLRPTDGSPPKRPPLPAAVREWLTCLSGQPCADRVVEADLPTPPFVEGFDRPYTYEDVPVRGIPTEGFGPLQAGGGTWRWTTATDAAVFARLSPGRYRIRFRVLRSAAAGIADTAVLTLNNLPLATTRKPDGPSGAILTADGTIGTGSPTADRLGIRARIVPLPQYPGTFLGLAVASVTVTRLPNAG